MNDKAVGIIGQKYEDRKTGKSGTLESRDDKYKTLLFRADDGSTFSISNSSFRSNWRKVKDEEVDTESVVEETTSEVQEEVTESTEEVEAGEETAPEAEEKPKKKRKSEKKVSEPFTRKSYEGISNEDAIASFVDTLMQTRKVGVANEPDCLSIFVDDMIVIRINHNEDDTFNLAMLPDVFTLSEWRGILKPYSVEYKTGAANYLGVFVETKESCIPEILDIIVEAVRDINLYGYMEEDCEESTDEED